MVARRNPEWLEEAVFYQIYPQSFYDANFTTNFFYSQPGLNYGFARPDPVKPWQQPMDAPGPQAAKADPAQDADA